MIGNETTIPLYDEDSYETTFHATVLRVEENRVVLDRTLFFPEQAGQKADKGSLEEQVAVIDVQIAQGVITHIVDWNGCAPFAVGQKVCGVIDFARRFDFMQQHSGEHILSGLAHRLYGCNNVGFHLSEREMTLDFDRLLTKEEVRELEKQANAAVFANHPIVISYPSQEEEKTLAYRSKKEITDRLRIVSIKGVDVCACCAPHVHATGEIGLIKIIKQLKNKGGTRLKAVCGWRAYAYLEEESRILHEAGDMLSTSVQNVPDRIRRFKEEIYGLKGQLKALNKTHCDESNGTDGK